MRILLAAGASENVDVNEGLRKILQQNNLEVAGDCYSADVLVNVAQQLSADTVIISILLGDQDILVGVIKTLRERGIRIIVLPGDIEHEETRQFVAKIIPFGVYDLVFDEVKPEMILQRLHNPAALGDIPEFLVNAAMAKQKLSMEISAHAEKVVAEAEIIKQKDKSNGRKLNLFNFINLNNKIKNEKLDNKNKTSWHERFINPKKTDEKINENIETTTIKTKETVDSPKLKTTDKIPTTVLGLGNQNLNEWFKNTFSHTAEIVLAASSPEEFRTAVQENQPDIAVIMRAGPTGGLPYADELAVFSCQYTRYVIFIAGELDDEGKIMAETVKKAGGKVLSCPPGETISGEELVLLIQNTINETIYEDEQEEEIIYGNEKTRGSAENFLQSISQVTDILKKAVPRRTETEELPINTARIPKHPSAITAGGVLLIVSPWRPGLAGRIAASAAKIFSEGGGETAVICASGRSTAASWLGVTDEELILSDWRVPGSQIPVDRGNIKIWAVDPAKSLHMNIKEDLPYILKEARNKANYTVIDFGEDIDLAQSYIHQKEAVLLCVVPGSDPVEQKTSLIWLKRTLGKKDNIVIGFDLREQGRIPEGVSSKLTITTSPEEALQNALKKNLDQYIWNEVIS
ncbi:hypothetical protein SAMN02745133_02958 [Desulforamulus putei DSM 12395]|uniref:Uncharacterized protein n=1 Tax=Desulforamulus putei DSM 12395 TaxID=1121429 RepID=A0A1M5CL88_9FIRM|nr:hypothetical protein [Desulforamulus putei]SHF55524.1 hypothetical protein SAMN02745133_02958 [Desulforamulus putei DSM 12395]